MSKKKRKKKQEEAGPKAEPGPQSCMTEGCMNSRAPGHKYCQVCFMTITFNKQAERANRRGDIIATLANIAGAFLFDGIRTGSINTGGIPVQHQRPFRRPAAPPPPQKKDPWAILGLEPQGTTEADVRRIQRAAGQMWHEDKGGGARAQDRLAEINAAAEECIRQIRSRRAAG